MQVYKLVAKLTQNGAAEVLKVRNTAQNIKSTLSLRDELIWA